MKYIATTKGKINSIPVVSGQMIFSRDDRAIYLDSDLGRTSFQQIITLIDENQREDLTNPIEGFYFVKESKKLYNYENGVWIALSGEGEALKQITFDNREDFPKQGKENMLYVDKKYIYQWDKDKQDYIKMSGGDAEELLWKDINEE